MNIRILRDDETIRYAAEELLKYLKLMTEGIDGVITVGDFCDDCINMGLSSDLGLFVEDNIDPMVDDIIDFNIESLSGHIGGSNPRSVLFGVYNFLKSAGCRWVRPGKCGEYIPKMDMTHYSYSQRKIADFQFRGECGEGACSFEHMRDTILWFPKVNMNLFMIQQVVPYNFMHRWYRHIDNTRLPHDDVPYQVYVENCEAIERLVKKCGLQLHMLGHGALTEPFGIRHMAKGYKYDLSDEAKKAFALVNGKRELYDGSPFQTQFCMSQEWVREKVISWIIDFLKQKPHIDFLHFWLGDGINNHCECDDCKKDIPSDLFVEALNELDRRLTEQGNDSKIVFIIYCDTLWPPIKHKINNPKRFILLAACGTGKNYSARRYEGGIPAWKRNDFELPETGMAMTLTFIDGWRDVFEGKKLLFEYFLYTYHFADLGGINLSRWMANNMKQLGTTGFDGVMSCQTQRSYFPTGLPTTIIGEFLYNSKLDTEEYIDDYFKACFGDGFLEAKEYLEAITRIFDVKSLTQNTDVTAQDTGAVDKKSKKATIFGNARVGDIIAQAPTIVDNFAKVIDKNLKNLTVACHRESWEILRYHGEYCKWVSKIYFALSRNDSKGAEEILNEAMDYLSEVEPRISPYFDNFLFKRRTSQIIAGK